MAKVLISVRDEFLKKVDDLAESEHRTRSELIREALRQYMKDKIDPFDLVINDKGGTYVAGTDYAYIHGGRPRG